MQIDIKTTNLDLTPALKIYLEKKLNSLHRLLKKFEEKTEIYIRVELARTTYHHKKGNVFYAETNLSLPKSLLRAESSASNIRTAINLLIDKLKQEIKKYKDKFEHTL
jgi:ribosomal subunit interface protein